MASTSKAAAAPKVLNVEEALRDAEAMVKAATAGHSDVAAIGATLRKTHKERNSLRTHIERDARIRQLPMYASYHTQLKDIEIRPYQTEVVEKTLSRRDVSPLPLQSSIVVLPCGAGKTLVGMATCVSDCQGGAVDPANAVGDKAFLIVAHGPEGADHWYRSFCEHTTFDRDSIVLLKSGSQDQIIIPGHTRIVIAGIGLLTKTDGEKSPLLTALRKLKIHRAVLDECHMIPAQNARQILIGKGWNIERWTGLTASPLRADNQYGWIVDFIGVELRPIGWRELEAQGFLTPLSINMVRCPLPDSWRATYDNASPEERRKYDLFNPRKLCMLETLLRHWKRQNDLGNGSKRVTIIFCDTIELLRMICNTFKIVYIDGTTSQEDTIRWLDAVRTGALDVIAMSRSGDQGIDIPRVSRVVILDALDGSQRQEVQRAGRALRPHPDKAEAQLFDIHTDSPRCTEYAQQRIQFLEEQNYQVNYMTTSYMNINGVQVASDLIHFDETGVPWYNQFSDTQEQLKILESIRSFAMRKEMHAEELERSIEQLKTVRRQHKQHTDKRKRMHNNRTLDSKTKGLFNKRFKSESVAYNRKIVATQQTRESHETFLMEKKPYSQISIDAMISNRKEN